MKTMKNFKNWLLESKSSDEKEYEKPTDTNLVSIKFKIPAIAKKDFDENIFGYYYEIDELCDKLIEDGFDAEWFRKQYERWADQNDNTDFDIEAYVDSEWGGNWNNFQAEFELLDGLINDIVDRSENRDIYDKLKKDFNEDDMLEYFDEAKEYGLVSMKVIGDKFESNRFTVEVNGTRELTDIEIDKIIDYLEGQCSDGFGESFEQHQVKGYYVSTWWSDEDNNKYGDYEIDVED
jgi:hypothetical protein